MTNVRPGDLAHIKAPFAERFRGLVVTVEHRATLGMRIFAKNGDSSFLGSESRIAWVCNANDPAFPHVVADACLAPIRDPGDDAEDDAQ